MGSTFNALFCTAQIPTSKIKDLLHHADNTTKAGNIFCLITSADQKSVDKPTPPTDVADFTTGFTDRSVESLGKFCKGKFNQNNPKSQPPYIAAEEFAVLDSRFLQDSTVLLVKYDFWDERIDPNDPSDLPEAFREREGWRTVRVPWQEAPDMMQALGEINMSEVVDRVGEDGVYRSKSRT